MSTKKVLVFISICLALNGFTLMLFHGRVNKSGVEGNTLITTDQPPNFVADSNNSPEERQKAEYHHQKLQEEEKERVKSLQYVRRFKRTRRTLKFFHVPKAAGTAVEQIAGERMKLAWGSCLFNHKPKRNSCNYPKNQFEWPRNYGWWHLPSHFFPIGGVDPYAGAELFGIVRDPFDRLVSEFYYICQLKVLRWRPDQCNRTRLFEKDYMNEWLQSKLDHRNLSDARIYLQDNGHFTSQYDFLVSKRGTSGFGVRMVDYVLRMEEDLPQHFRRLMDAYNLELKMPGKKLNVARDAAVAHLEVKDLDHVTVASIQKVFPNDFDLSPLYQKTPWKTKTSG